MAVVPLVEGYAEVESVRVLLNRLGVYAIARPFRVARNRVVRDGELERAVQLALNTRHDPTAVLILLDADNDAACRLAPELLQRSEAVTDLPAAVVFPVREFEAWFLASVESLRGVRGIREDAAFAGDPEAPRGAKERLSELMLGRSYLDVDDQPALVAQMDIDMARTRSPSFAKLVRDLSRIAGVENA